MTKVERILCFLSSLVFVYRYFELYFDTLPMHGEQWAILNIFFLFDLYFDRNSTVLAANYGSRTFDSIDM